MVICDATSDFIDIFDALKTRYTKLIPKCVYFELSDMKIDIKVRQ